MAASIGLRVFKPFCMPLSTNVCRASTPRLQFSHISVKKAAVFNSELSLNRRFKSHKKEEDRVLPPIKVKRYFYNRLITFITTSVNRMEKTVPKPFQVYRTFRSGLSLFMSDTKRFYEISSRLWGGESLSHFTRRELELYRTFSSDLPKIGVLLIIAFAPGGVLVFPLAYMFPRYFLSSHFWSKQQRKDFMELDLRAQVKHYPGVLKNVYANSKKSPEKELIKKAVNKLDISVNLSQKDFVSLKPLFAQPPYSLNAISLNYRWQLSRCLGFSLRRLRKKKLVEDALLLRFMDVALLREGLHNLSSEDLDMACAWRGLNPEGMERNTKLAYLKQWAEITSDIHEPNISLLLHLPVLMGYCRSSNRRLMGPRTTTSRQ